uniref:Uncharacterized protein n=1 Tax=Candidozyma auris TaxID=498019 RepID=A0A0L0P4T7_CANAR
MDFGEVAHDLRHFQWGGALITTYCLFCGLVPAVLKPQRRQVPRLSPRKAQCSRDLALGGARGIARLVYAVVSFKSRPGASAKWEEEEKKKKKKKVKGGFRSHHLVNCLGGDTRLGFVSCAGQWQQRPLVYRPAPAPAPANGSVEAAVALAD